MRKAKHSVQLVSGLQPFALTRLSVCGFDVRLFSHLEDKVIGDWVRGNRPWSHQDVAEYERIVELAKSSHVIVDVGSNIGLVSILMSKAAPHANIFAFEPEPINFALSQMNYRLNGCRNIFGINAAVSDSIGTTTLYKSSQNWGDHRTYRPTENELNESFCAAGQLALTIEPNIFFSKIEHRMPIDLLKIDTQGSDVKILLAFKNLLAPSAIVVLEFSPHHLLASGTTETDIREALSSAGQIEVIIPPDGSQRFWHTASITPEDLIKYFHSGHAGYQSVGYRDLLIRYEANGLLSTKLS